MKKELIWEEWKETRFKLIEESVRNNMWKSHGFTTKKAFVASLLSQLAYIHVTEFERNNLKRTKLIPCYLFHHLVQTHTFIDLKTELLQEDEQNEAIIIENNSAVVVAFRRFDTLFITIRGTNKKEKDDWIVDFSFRKKESYRGYHTPGKYHQGFLTEATLLYEELLQEISTLFKNRNPQNIVITGHSLGGALATHISFWLQEHFFCNFSNFTNFETYTFGTPRIGNHVAISNLCIYANMCDHLIPFIINNVEDFVPRLPLKICGYASFPMEYQLQRAESFSFRKYINEPLKRFRGDYHNLESYIQRLELIM